MADLATTSPRRDIRPRTAALVAGLGLLAMAMAIIAYELEILGSHGKQAHRYGAMLDMVLSGKLAPQQLVGWEISLAESIDALMSMDKIHSVGATFITEF